MDDAKWLKDCEICNVGLCKRVDELTAKGASIRDAARTMEKESRGLWDASKIRDRYRYYKGLRTGGAKPPRATAAEVKPKKLKKPKTEKPIEAKNLAPPKYTPGGNPPAEEAVGKIAKAARDQCNRENIEELVGVNESIRATFSFSTNTGQIVAVTVEVEKIKIL